MCKFSAHLLPFLGKGLEHLRVLVSEGSWSPSLLRGEHASDVRMDGCASHGLVCGWLWTLIIRNFCCFYCLHEMQSVFLLSLHHIRNYFLQMNLKYLSWIVLFLTECFSLEFLYLKVLLDPFFFFLKRFFIMEIFWTSAGAERCEGAHGGASAVSVRRLFIPCPVDAWGTGAPSRGRKVPRGHSSGCCHCRDSGGHGVGDYGRLKCQHAHACGSF